MKLTRFVDRVRAGVYLIVLGILIVVPVSGEAADFYAGYSPGGRIDTNTRAVARQLGKYIPGNPKSIAKNMPGAGGAIATNYLYNKAKADGLSIGMAGRGWLLSPLLEEPGAKHESFTA